MLARVTANEIKANFIWVKVRNIFIRFSIARKLMVVCSSAHSW